MQKESPQETEDHGPRCCSDRLQTWAASPLCPTFRVSFSCLWFPGDWAFRGQLGVKPSACQTASLNYFPLLACKRLGHLLWNPPSADSLISSSPPPQNRCPSASSPSLNCMCWDSGKAFQEQDLGLTLYGILGPKQAWHEISIGNALLKKQTHSKQLQRSPNWIGEASTGAGSI